MKRLTALTTLAVITVAWIGLAIWMVPALSGSQPSVFGGGSNSGGYTSVDPDRVEPPCDSPPCITELIEPVDDTDDSEPEVVVPDIPGPAVIDAGSLTFTVRLSQGLVDPMGTDELYAEVEIEAVDELPDERPSLNTALVVDRSGSMRTEPMQRAREAAHTFVDGLDSGDRASLVAFDHRSEVVMGSTLLDDAGQQQMHSAIDRLQSSGRTNISGGLQDGFREVDSVESHDGIERIVLMTDGVPNVGITSQEGLAAKAAEMRQQGVAVTTLGFGRYNAEMMAAMASEGGGNFRHISSAADLEQAFGEELDDIQSTVASDLAVDIFESDGVAVEEVHGFSSQGLRNGERIPVGDMAAGETRSIVVELDVRQLAAEAGEIFDIVDVRPHFVDHIDGGDVDVTASSTIGITEQREAIDESTDPYVMDRVEELKTVSAVRQAAELHQQGRSNEAQRRLQEEQRRIGDVSAREGSRGASVDRMEGMVESAEEAMEAAPSSPEADDSAGQMETQFFDASQGR